MRHFSILSNLTSCIWILVWCGYYLLPTDATKSSDICRDESLGTQEPLAIADIIVIGSGPGGVGFLYRFVRNQPNMTVLWIEKGKDFLARNWPGDIRKNRDVLTPIPRFKKKMVGYAWNNYGGGDAGNSGGPNYVGLHRPRQDPYEPVDVVKLRNHSIIPTTNTSLRWIEAFNKTGYGYVGPTYSRQSLESSVGLLSSLRTPDGRERLLLANDLRYSDDNKVTYVHARVTSIIHDKDDGTRDATVRATGVRGVRIDGDQGEYGGCVTWRARTAVVLAGGVFNSFDVLVESGLGPQKALDVREVPTKWREPNEQVGQGVGDEYPSVFLSVEPEKQDQYGAEARLVAHTTDTGSDASYEMWGHGVYSWLQFSNSFYDFLLGSVLPNTLPGLNRLTTNILGRTSMWSVSIFHEPNMTLIATKKPQNATSSHNNPLGMKINDTMVEFTDEMCMNLTHLVDPFIHGAKLQKKACKKPSLARFVLALASKLGLTKLLHPNPITAQNVHTYTGRGKNKGKKCSLNQVSSYYHFYGGNAYAVNAGYILNGTKNLYISDASVIQRLAPGAPASVVMEQGMKVADAVIADLNKTQCSG